MNKGVKLICFIYLLFRNVQPIFTILVKDKGVKCTGKIDPCVNKGVKRT